MNDDWVLLHLLENSSSQSILDHIFLAFYFPFCKKVLGNNFSKCIYSLLLDIPKAKNFLWNNTLKQDDSGRANNFEFKDLGFTSDYKFSAKIILEKKNRYAGLPY